MADETPKIADAGAAGWVGYTIAVVMAWVYLAGYVDATAGIYMAGISVACLIAYTYAAVTQLKLGNLAGGVTWAYFGAFFAGASAFNYLIGWMAAKYAWEADGRIQGWMWIVLGIVLIIETPIFMKYSNAAAWISIIAADIGIVTLSFVFWGKGGSAMVDISAWSFFVAGVGGVLNAGDGILQGVGWKLPLGPPIIPTKAAAPPEEKVGY
jgi:hypothetical protein